MLYNKYFADTPSNLNIEAHVDGTQVFPKNNRILGTTTAVVGRRVLDILVVEPCLKINVLIFNFTVTTDQNQLF